LTKISDLPRLEIVPVDSLVLHEYFDDQRAHPLVKKIEDSGILRNPPIVSPFRDGTHRHLVLDGANRSTAMHYLGVAHIVVQVVDENDDGLHISSWNHVIWGIPTDEIIESIQMIPDLALQPMDCESVPPDLVVFCAPDEQVYNLCIENLDLIRQLRILNMIVDCYKDQAQLDRTQVTDVNALRRLYPKLSGLLIFPVFGLDQIMYAAGNGSMMPPGSTRFMISPRVLHLNYPMKHLAADRSLDQKNAELHTWIQDRLAAKRVRYYAESTLLFDE
jgi:hypothetical protein